MIFLTNTPYFKKWEVVTLDWGFNIKCMDKSIYTKNEILNYKAINYGAEFSNIDNKCKINKHMGIIVSIHSFNNKTVLVAPITSKTQKDDIKHKNKFFLYKKNYKGLRNDSVILLDKIREIDKERINRHLFFLKEAHHKEFDRRLSSVFGLKN